MSRRNGAKFLAAGAVAALALCAGSIVIAAEVPSEQQILQALKPKPLTRGLTQSPTDIARKQDEEKFVEALRTRRTRGLSVGDREKVAEIAKDKPSIDLEINFDYNSAEINSRSLPGVTNLGKALSQMPGSVFVLAGHTDAKGGDGYNQSLSERRADAVRKYLVSKFQVPAENLVTVGYGKSHIKNPSDPFADENRRVQIVNMKSN
jgi:outer membrane protein OmpA-like peptidoglycan-associated protein